MDISRSMRAARFEDARADAVGLGSFFFAAVEWRGPTTTGLLAGTLTSLWKRSVMPRVGGSDPGRRAGVETLVENVVVAKAEHRVTRWTPDRLEVVRSAVAPAGSREQRGRPLRRDGEVKGRFPLDLVERAAAFAHVLEGDVESVASVLRGALLDHGSHGLVTPLPHSRDLNTPQRGAQRPIRYEEAKGRDVLLNATGAFAHRPPGVGLDELREVLGLEPGVHRQQNPRLLDLRPHIDEQADEQPSYFEPTLFLDLEVLCLLGRAPGHLLTHDDPGEPDPADDQRFPHSLDANRVHAAAPCTLGHAMSTTTLTTYAHLGRARRAG